jgi:mRNA interferase MazF
MQVTATFQEKRSINWPLKSGIRTIVMPLPRIQRGELWLVDLGYLGKVRPVCVASVPFLDNERTLCIIVPHTTSVIGTRFEIEIPHPALQRGVFDVQQTTAVQAAKFVRRLGALDALGIVRIESGLAAILGLELASR